MRLYAHSQPISSYKCITSCVDDIGGTCVGTYLCDMLSLLLNDGNWLETEKRSLWMLGSYDQAHDNPVILLFSELISVVQR